jgi:hypothetical protein
MTAVLIASALFASTALPPETDARAVTSMKRERTALYVTAATDILTTRHAITRGAVEGNPLVVKMMGHTPSTLKLVALKAGVIGVIEWLAAHERKRGNYKLAKALYVIAAVPWGTASGLNLRFAFQ